MVERWLLSQNPAASTVHRAVRRLPANRRSPKRRSYDRILAKLKTLSDDETLLPSLS